MAMHHSSSPALRTAFLTQTGGRRVWFLWVFVVRKAHHVEVRYCNSFGGHCRPYETAQGPNSMETWDKAVKDGGELTHKSTWVEVDCLCLYMIQEVSNWVPVTTELHKKSSRLFLVICLTPITTQFLTPEIGIINVATPSVSWCDA